MIILGPFTHNFDEGAWGCEAINGHLCHTGLSGALDTELEPSNSYELRVYEQRPRTDVSELTLEKQPLDSWYNSNEGRRVVDEFGTRHEIDGYFIDFIEAQLGHLKDEEGEITFYARPLDLGEAPKVPCDGHYDAYSNEVVIEAEDGSTARIKVDLAGAEWS
jgi:hypothetical protein